MRLIDADELMTVTDIREDGTKVTYVPYSEIEDASTAYDPDKIVAELEDNFNATKDKRVRLAYHHAIKIVKGGGMNESQT